MGLLDTLLGRTKPVAPDLDRLFGLPGAALTLQVTEGLTPTLQAAACFKPAAGQAFGQAEQELLGLLRLDTPGPGGSGSPGGSAAGSAAGAPAAGSPDLGAVRMEHDDQFGYRWVVVSGTDFDTVVTRVHFVNSTLKDHGYGPQLLCSVFGFARGAPSGEEGTLVAAPPGAKSWAYLVYLYKRGSFYPFVPLGNERRDNEAELRLKELLGEDLTIEKDLDRWFPLWGLPIR